MNEDKLDQLLSLEARRRGWAETKTQYAARILKHVLSEIEDDKAIRSHFNQVIKYLEAYKFDD